MGEKGSRKGRKEDAEDAKIIIRSFCEEDAQGLLEAHYSAVHEIASKDYSKEICNSWSPLVNKERINSFLNQDKSEVIQIVAENQNKILGFAEYSPKNNQLWACYVHSNYNGKGVAKRLINYIHKDAIKREVKFLEMDSSITAMPFYQKMGYEIISEGEHELCLGGKMKCYKMKKNLSDLSGKNIK